jgi:tetratricopeptide (TPR) repeat protein
MSVNWKRVALFKGKVAVRPRAAQRRRMTARPGRAVTLLLCGLLSCAPPSVAPVSRRDAPEAAAPGGSCDGGPALSVQDGDAAPEDAESESAAAGAGVYCPLDVGLAGGPVNPVEGGVTVPFLDRGAHLLMSTGVWGNGSHVWYGLTGNELRRRIAVMEQIVANTSGAGDPSGVRRDELYRLATHEAMLGAAAQGARAVAEDHSSTVAAAACAAIEKEASDRAIAAYSQLRTEIATDPPPDAGVYADGGVYSAHRVVEWQEVLELLAWEYRRANDPASARRVYSYLLARGLPAAVAAGHLGLGDLACVAAVRGDDKQWNVAIAEYRRAIQAMPPASERQNAWYSLGYVLRRRGDVRGALDAFERAARVTSHADLVGTNQVRSGFRRALLMTYAEVGTPAGAFEAFRRVSDDPPGWSREAVGMMSDLATEYVRLGRTRDAIAALRELVARDPEEHCLWIERLGALDGQTTAPDCKATGR